MNKEARYYRPKIFAEVVGQQATVQTLKNAIKKNRVANAYLFCGSHGTGKTTLARLFAKALNCLNASTDFEPCNQCTHCHQIDHANSIDVLEIDGASHRGIEDIRQINDTCAFIPTSCKYKIYLIDEVHMLTKEAFNALLKTLEEPPENVKFFFATTEVHKLPKTIISRCQRFNLKRIQTEMVIEKLSKIAKRQSIEIEPEALHLIAHFAKGGMRDAESLFDQLTVFEEGMITKKGVFALLGLTPRELFFKLDHAKLESDLSLVFEISQEVVETGKSCIYFLSELTDHFRTLLLIKTGSMPLFYDKEEEEKYQKSAPLYEIEQIISIIHILNEAESKLTFALSDKIWLEQLLLKILQSKKTLSVESLVKRLLSLEKKIENAATVSEEVKKKVITKPTLLEKAREEETPLSKKNRSLKEQSRYDTIMRFAAKELQGSLKTEI